MKRVILYTIAASMICCNYACNKEDSLDLSTEGLYKKLETAYQLSSTKNLEQFFRNWNTSISSNTDEFIKQSDIIETVYEVYRKFYNPLDLTKLGDWEWGNGLNSNSKYVVVQNKIYFTVVENRILELPYFFDYIYDSINDFRPPLNLAKEQVLYLLPEYEKSLNMFLGTESTKLGENGIMTPSMPKGDSDKRYAFIRPYIPILHGHWGGYWHLATHPEIFRLVLNTEKTAAKIFFRVGYQGGEAILKKKSNEWIIEESRATWIE